MKTRILSWVGILVGNLLLALAVHAFIVPSGLPVTGVTGIALLLFRLLGLPVTLSILFLNLAFLALGYLLFGRRFFLSTLLSSLLYPVLLSLFELFLPFSVPEDPLLSLLFGGGLLGVGIGLVMRAGASTGGVDILQLLLSRKLHLPMSAAVLFVDAAILLLLSFAYSPASLLYAVLLIGVEAILLERTLLYGQDKLLIEAVTTRPREVADALMLSSGHGATLLSSVGAYTGEAQKLVFSVISVREAALARRAVFSADPRAFLMVLPLRDVEGEGFRKK